MTILIGHIIAATMNFFNMQSLSDGLPSCLSQLLLEENFEIRRHKFHLAVGNMISKHFNISSFDKEDEEDDDKVRAYAKEVLSLGVLLLEFKDSVQEGDGERLLLVWRFLLLIFRASNKTKYSFEALNLLLQQNVLLPPRLKYQLMYSRFINTKGKPGTNISIDLHMEHINKIVKGALSSQSSNLSPKAIIRTGQCTGAFVKIAEQFDKVSSLHKESSTHSDAKLIKDITVIVNQLHDTFKVYQYVPKRTHKHFSSLTKTIIAPVKKDKAKILQWMNKHLKSML